MAIAFSEQAWNQALGWQPSPAQLSQFAGLYHHICARNRQLNLTRITESEAFWEKHLWDSLRGIEPWLTGPATTMPLPEDARVIDIGTGGGFPGLPVAIARPGWQVSLLDSTRKKMAFLETMVSQLALNKATMICDRAEHLGQHHLHRQQYDLALIRAVGPVAVCAEYALPLVKLGGVAVLYRGQWAPAQTANLAGVLQQLGGKIVEIVNCQTPIQKETRHFIYIQKQEPTPVQFPRKVGRPVKHPLGEEPTR